MTAPPYRKKPNRLPGYDYSQPGAYFVTLCLHDRRCSFGDVVDSAMVPNDIGRMILSEWSAMQEATPGIELDTVVLMPDHLHGIIMLATDPAVPTGPSLGAIIGEFKGKSTNQYLANARDGIWPRIDRRLWQLRYHDRIIRNDRELVRIRDYILANPKRWQERNM